MTMTSIESPVAAALKRLSQLQPRLSETLQLVAETAAVANEHLRESDLATALNDIDRLAAQMRHLTSTKLEIEKLFTVNAKES